MPINVDHLTSLRSRNTPVAYGDRETILYALAIGMGRDSTELKELPYVFEGGGLRTVPTFASILAPANFLAGCGLDATQVEHTGERLTLHRALADSASLLLDCRITDVIDNGAESGVVILMECRARSAQDDQPVFTLNRTFVARGDGGFLTPAGGEHAAPLEKSLATPLAMPPGPPDLTCVLKMRDDQALMFRLCGDRDPPYADPPYVASGQARRPGLARQPFMQRLCIYGVACRAVLKTICEYDHTLIKSFDSQFSAPVYPGDTLVTDMWQTANIVSFQVRALARDEIVLSHGRCVLAT
jgi:acyl dehydratase